MEHKKCYICKIVKSVDEFYFDNKEKTKLQSKCKSCLKGWKKIKLKRNVEYRILHNQKRRVRQICKEMGFIKTEKFDKFFGTTTSGLKKYLEELFYDKISWDNYNVVWEVDHKIPLLNVNSYEKLKKLAHYTNLQPLLITDHKSKSSQEIKTIIPQYL